MDQTGSMRDQLRLEMDVPVRRCGAATEMALPREIAAAPRAGNRGGRGSPSPALRFPWPRAPNRMGCGICAGPRVKDLGRLRPRRAAP
jgi:hypothetical protein